MRIIVYKTDICISRIIPLTAYQSHTLIIKTLVLVKVTNGEFMYCMNLCLIMQLIFLIYVCEVV